MLHAKGVVLLAAATTALAVVAVAPGAASAAGAGTTTTVWVAKRSCDAPRPGKAACFAMKLVAQKQKLGQPAPAGAMARDATPALTDGPAGGYTPASLAKAYGVDANAAAGGNVTVAIVDAFSDPNVLADLNTFNAHYGLPAETATSFKVVNQDGASSPLPAGDHTWGEEITLDVQTVRGLCHKCKIVLVEATTNAYTDFEAAENTAVSMHASIVSNSWGGFETSGNTASLSSAFNHPKVAILASTGDDGWDGWDILNAAKTPPSAPNVPASLPTVVGVGGTSLYLNPDGSRASETVWNNNGPADRVGFNLGITGAAGGGCSTLSTAKPWQQKVANYATLGCGATRRSGTDIAAIADPFTGYDIYDTYGDPGWETFGGTSLSSPVVGALWALAGGPGGVDYPSLSLYGHFKSEGTAHLYDVTVGGTGMCSTYSPTSCFNSAGQNPNTLGYGLIDCAFGAQGTPVLGNRAQCYARPGYDGVSGVGVPKGTAAFTAMNPKAVIHSPGTVTHHVAKVFSSSGTSDPFPGGSITAYKWTWGDGTSSTGASPTHNYAAAGTRTITLTVTDNYGRSGKTTLNISVH
jgi:hypothetical protein